MNEYNIKKNTHTHIYLHTYIYTNTEMFCPSNSNRLQTRKEKRNETKRNEGTFICYVIRIKIKTKVKMITQSHTLTHTDYYPCMNERAFPF